MTCQRITRGLYATTPQLRQLERMMGNLNKISIWDSQTSLNLGLIFALDNSMVSMTWLRKITVSMNESCITWVEDELTKTTNWQ